MFPSYFSAFDALLVPCHLCRSFNALADADGWLMMIVTTIMAMTSLDNNDDLPRLAGSNFTAAWAAQNEKLLIRSCFLGPFIHSFFNYSPIHY